MESETNPDSALDALDKTALRALAHPSRLRILSHIRTDGPKTVSKLAELSGESTATVSYHVRRLAGAGLLEREDDPSLKAHPREVWWRAKATGSLVESPGESGPEDEVMASYLSAVASVHAGRIRESAVGRPGRAPLMSDAMVTVSVEQLDTLTEQLAALLARYSEPSAGERFLVQYQFLPLATGPD